MFEITNDVHFHIWYNFYGAKWYYFFDSNGHDNVTEDKTKADVLSEKESEEIIKKLMRKFGNIIFQMEQV